MTTEIIKTVGAVVELLKPLESEDRFRVVNAALSLLGTPTVAAGLEQTATNGPEPSLGHLSPRAQSWAKQNGISAEQLSEIFHIENGEVEVIAADVPGKNSKEKTHNAYVLYGISRLLSAGSPAFDDKPARALCKTLGCLNEANHSTYLAEKGNEFTGSKQKGWTLTAPGLKRGAVLIKELSTNQP